MYDSQTILVTPKTVNSLIEAILHENNLLTAETDRLVNQLSQLNGIAQSLQRENQLFRHNLKRRIYDLGHLVGTAQVALADGSAHHDHLKHLRTALNGHLCKVIDANLKEEAKTKEKLVQISQEVETVNKIRMQLQEKILLTLKPQEAELTTEAQSALDKQLNTLHRDNAALSSQLTNLLADNAALALQVDQLVQTSSLKATQLEQDQQEHKHRLLEGASTLQVMESEINSLRALIGKEEDIEQQQKDQLLKLNNQLKEVQLANARLAWKRQMNTNQLARNNHNSRQQAKSQKLQAIVNERLGLEARLAELRHEKFQMRQKAAEMQREESHKHSERKAQLKAKYTQQLFEHSKEAARIKLELSSLDATNKVLEQRLAELNGSLSKHSEAIQKREGMWTEVQKLELEVAASRRI